MGSVYIESERELVPNRCPIDIALGCRLYMCTPFWLAKRCALYWNATGSTCNIPLSIVGLNCIPSLTPAQA